MSATPTLPISQFAPDDLLTRYVVVTNEDMHSWSIHAHHVDGTPDTSPFVQQPVVIDDTGRVVFDDYRPTQAWAHVIDAETLLISLDPPCPHTYITDDGVDDTKLVTANSVLSPTER